MLAINFTETAGHYEGKVKNPYEKNRRGSLRKMGKELEKAAKLDPVSPEVKSACYRMLDLHLDFIEEDLVSGKVANAKSDIQELIKISEKLSKIYRENEQEEFVDWANKKVANAYGLLVNSYYKNKQYSKAIRWLDSLLLREPENYDALQIKTVCLLKTAKLHEAREEFEKLYSVVGNKQEILHLGMDIYYKTKEYVKVIELAEIALNSDKTDGRAYVMSISAYFKLAKAVYHKDKALSKEYTLKAKNVVQAALESIGPASEYHKDVRDQMDTIKKNLRKFD